MAATMMKIAGKVSFAIKHFALIDLEKLHKAAFLVYSYLYSTTNSNTPNLLKVGDGKNR